MLKITQLQLWPVGKVRLMLNRVLFWYKVVVQVFSGQERINGLLFNEFSILRGRVEI